MNPDCPVCLRPMLDAQLNKTIGLVYSCKRCGLELNNENGFARRVAIDFYGRAKPASQWKRLGVLLDEQFGNDKEVSQ